MPVAIGFWQQLHILFQHEMTAIDGEDDAFARLEPRHFHAQCLNFLARRRQELLIFLMLQKEFLQPGLEWIACFCLARQRAGLKGCEVCHKKHLHKTILQREATGRDRRG